jgi:hypothetical protein
MGTPVGGSDGGRVAATGMEAATDDIGNTGVLAGAVDITWNGGTTNNADVAGSEDDNAGMPP